MLENLGRCSRSSVKLKHSIAVSGLVMAEGVLGVGWLPLHRACVLTPGLSVPVPADPTPSKAMAVDELQWWPFPNRVLCLEKAEWLKTVPLLALPQREGLSLPGPASRAPK